MEAHAGIAAIPEPPTAVQVMHVDSFSVFETVVPRVPSRRKRKHRLADYQPVPQGRRVLNLLRAQELFRGKPWKTEEEEHCQGCAWCWYFVSHDERECSNAPIVGNIVRPRSERRRMGTRRGLSLVRL